MFFYVYVPKLLNIQEKIDSCPIAEMINLPKARLNSLSLTTHKQHLRTPLSKRIKCIYPHGLS